MPRLRAKFAKKEPVRFISHLDLMRTVARAVRRAQLPIAFSGGYHPQPRIAYGSALPVGMTSDGEYVDMEFTEPLPVAELPACLNRQLPEGIDFLRAVEIEPRARSLMGIINRAQYTVTGQLKDGTGLKQAVADLLAATELLVVRERRRGKQQINLRPMIFAVEVLWENDGIGALSLLVQTGSAGNVRPGEVLQFLPFRENQVKIHRVDLFISQGGRLLSPLEVVS